MVKSKLRKNPEAWIAEKAGYDVQVGDASPGNEYFAYGPMPDTSCPSVPQAPYDDADVGVLVQMVAKAGYDITLGPGAPSIVIVESFVGEVAATCCADMACVHRDDIPEALRLALVELMTEEGEK